MTHGPSHSTEISEREKLLLSHASEELSRVILAPVGNLMKSYSRIAVIPEGALQYIPFAALPVPGEFGPSPYVPLIATHDVVNLPSVSILAMLRQDVDSRKRIYARTASVVADPVFSADDPRVLAGRGRRSATIPTRSDVDSSRDNLTRSIQDRAQDTENKEIRLPRLLYSRLEAQAVASVVPKGKTYEALDFDASRATVTSSSFGNSRIIHFATHGFFDPKKPELSGLIFSMVDRTGEPEVGFYGLEDVFNASPTADLVVLSGCQTALGQEVDGEGLVGLAWGFLYAGANSVVASLWNVDDASTAELMRLFYEGMETNGLSPAKALRQAQLAICRRARWAFPYYWAPFIIEGDWTTSKTN
jgi:CHAT domain-containing protein